MGAQVRQTEGRRRPLRASITAPDALPKHTGVLQAETRSSMRPMDTHSLTKSLLNKRDRSFHLGHGPIHARDGGAEALISLMTPSVVTGFESR
jgi:hypothetical protein